MTIKLIVGLRNPGDAYARTRHNAGGWLVQALAMHCQSAFKTDKKMQAELASLELNGSFCIALLPLSFMNHSGFSVRAVTQFYRYEAQEVLVVHDELDLPAGCVRLKTGGGHGGHNGLRDITQQLGGSGFHRLRLGIGHPGDKDLVLDYVLGKPSVAHRQLIDDAIERAITVMPQILTGQIALAMNQLNGT